MEFLHDVLKVREFPWAKFRHKVALHTSCSAIARSPLGVAETGSVLFSEEELRVNTIGVYAHDIVILLDPANIVENIHDAYTHPHFRDKAYSLLMSGPSGSADIAGATVHPAQGVMTLTVIFWPRTKS